jgi:hypothetical protein
VAVVIAADRAYVSGRIEVCWPMPDVATSQRHVSRPLLVAAMAGGMLLAGTIVLWARYGSAVFYEMITAGIAACF